MHTLSDYASIYDSCDAESCDVPTEQSIPLVSLSEKPSAAGSSVLEMRR